ncbi:MAG: hypothetical protein ACE5IK_13735 [Acidobacteriota bacterium]
MARRLPPRACGPHASPSAVTVLGSTLGLLLAVHVAGCAPAAGEVSRTVQRYVQAVAQRDADTLMELYAPLAAALAAAPDDAVRDVLRREFRAFLDDQYAAYRRDRDLGKLTFSPEGVVLLRGLNVGRGAYTEVVETRFPGRDEAVLIQEVRLAYRSIDVDGLPPGTTIYLMGDPPGTIYNPVIGDRAPAARRLLERLWLRWTLTRGQGVWRVADVRPDPDRPPDVYLDTRRF